ncbi:MAG: transporter related protein [Paenibacillaceae bacterium]|jgi:ABC-2 type transport system ATP-binding protein|nr:transporter related protein [Paenibacillaceae bacterium]
MDEMLLKVNGLTKRYESFKLDGVSFQIPRGYIMGFIGQNGSGKSTTIKCIMNLIRYDAGEIHMFGQTDSQQPEKLKNRIGYVSEEPHFYDDMTVEWTGRFVGSFYTTWDDALFRKLLARFQVDRKKKAKELSRGMKVKLSLALAMAHHPELLILDEPTSGLDPVIRSELLDVFLEIIQNENCSIFFSSHISTDIEKVADYITIIHNGRIVASTDKLTLLDQSKVIKADNRYRNASIEAELSNLKVNDYGYSGITSDIRSFDRVWKSNFPEGEYKVEKLALDELLVRIAGIKGEQLCAN